MDTETRELTLRITESAEREIQAMRTRVSDLVRYYGPDSDWTLEAMRSLEYNLAGLLTSFFGNNAVVTRDGDLSLFVSVNDGAFVYGIIFHRVHRHCEVCGLTEGMEAYRSSDVPLCDEHTWNYPADAPVPGTWSFHS